MNLIKAKRQLLKDTNWKYPDKLAVVPEKDWPEEWRGAKEAPLQAWRSRKFFAMRYASGHCLGRLSFGRSEITSEGDWKDGLTWDDIMRLKAEAGYGDCWAIEIFPPVLDIVNVANLRHIWLLVEAPPMAWRAAPMMTVPEPKPRDPYVIELPRTFQGTCWHCFTIKFSPKIERGGLRCQECWQLNAYEWSDAEYAEWQSHYPA
jgi:hypothetical protein